MKEKKFDEKLMLNKKTIVNLDGEDMKIVYGGGGPSVDPQCVTNNEYNYTAWSGC
ncbi:MAG: hypothetical protein GY940_25165 [bacterium]|nr:hypothetical protein [bacterium]